MIADEAIRERRAGGRGHEALSERAARQLSQQEKSQRATYTVVNDGTERDLQDRLSAILDMLPSAPSQPVTVTASPAAGPGAPAPPRASAPPAAPAAPRCSAWPWSASSSVRSLLALPLSSEAVNDFGLPLQYPT